MKLTQKMHPNRALGAFTLGIYVKVDFIKRCERIGVIVHKKKYFIIFVPVLIIGLLLIYYLPANELTYLMLIPLIAWFIYYAWIYIEKRLKT